MAKPTIVDIPHQLGREAAKQRLRDQVGELAGHIPGGMADVQSTWPSADRMVIEIMAMGQRVTATLDVEDHIVRATFVLPGLLSFMGGAIEAAVRRKGGQVLLS
nr:polyhydroxyalkanoic acid system family protein [Polymorphobacter sp.]